MEKKGEILNQLAIISDLVEKINLNTKSNMVTLELPKVEFDKMFEIVQKKYEKKLEVPENTFKITIGLVDVVFNMSNA